MRFVPPALLALTSAILVALWDRIPERWVTHWGLHGQPDAWARRNPVDVFLPLALGLILWLVLEAVGAAVVRRSAKLPPRAVSATREFLRLVTVALVGLFCMLAVILPLARPRSPWLVVALALALLGAAVALGLPRLRRAMKEMNVLGWNGLTYRNADDARLWVPSLFGVGYTLNFAHRRAWAILVLLLAGPIGVVAALLVASRFS